MPWLAPFAATAMLVGRLLIVKSCRFFILAPLSVVPILLLWVGAVLYELPFGSCFFPVLMNFGAVLV